MSLSCIAGGVSRFSCFARPPSPPDPPLRELQGSSRRTVCEGAAAALQFPCRSTYFLACLAMQLASARNCSAHTPWSIVSIRPLTHAP